MQIVLADSSLDDWRIALSWPRALQLAGELLLCAVHPPPLLDLRVSQTATFFGSSRPQARAKLVPADQLLGVFMFLRCYLVGRALVLHSRLVTDGISTAAFGLTFCLILSDTITVQMTDQPASARSAR